MRIQDLGSNKKFIIEDTPEQGYLPHGHVATDVADASQTKDLDPNKPKPVIINNDEYIWLYDLSKLLGTPENKYKPKDYWDEEKNQPDMVAIMNRLENQKSQDNNTITKAIKYAEEEKLLDNMHEFSDIGYWHRIGGDGLPYNLGFSKNPDNKEVVAQLMYTQMGDIRFKPDYDDKTNSFNYSNNPLVVNGNKEQMGSDGRIFPSSKQKIKKDFKDKKAKFLDKTRPGKALEHNKPYTLPSTGVKFRYKNKYPSVDKKGNQIEVEMNPRKYPEDPLHQPYFERVADGKKVPFNSYEHAIICNALGFEPDTITPLPDSLKDKFKNWFDEKFGKFGVGLDPKAPVLTKILTLGIHDPISKVIFGGIRNNMEKKEQERREAYNFKLGYDIDESEEAKRTLKYWEQKTLTYANDLKRTTNEPGGITAAINQFIAHLDLYKEALDNDQIRQADKIQAQKNYDTYKSLVQKYYGSTFMKGDIVQVKPDNRQLPTINFSAMGVVQQRGQQGNKTLVPLMVYDNNGKMVKFHTQDTAQNDGLNSNEYLRNLEKESSVGVALHVPEIGMKYVDNPNARPQIYYFNVGEVHPVKPGKKTVVKSVADTLDQIKDELIQQKQKEQPTLIKNSKEEQKAFNEKYKEKLGGSLEELQQPATNVNQNIQLNDIDEYDDISYVGVDGKERDAQVIELNFNNSNKDWFKVQDPFTDWIEFALHKSRVTKHTPSGNR